MGRRYKKNERRRSRKRRRDFEFELDDLFDLDDFFEGKTFDWDDWGHFRRKVIYDSSRKPDTGLPIGLGVFVLFTALMFGFGPLLPLVGVLILFAGMASLAGRVFSGFKKLASRTFRRFFESKKKRQLRLLQDLEQRLVNDGEPRTEHLMRKLSNLYQTLEKDIQDGTLTVVAKDVLSSVDRVNKVCMDHLDESHKLWVEAQAEPYSRKLKLQQREALIQEVAQSVAHLEGIVAQLHEQSLNKNRNELKRLRDELDETLEVAKRVEQRTEELVSPTGEFERE